MDWQSLPFLALLFVVWLFVRSTAQLSVYGSPSGQEAQRAMLGLIIIVLVLSIRKSLGL
jgi:hypothetical protein